MPVNDKSLVIPGRGTIYTAPANTVLPTGGMAAFANITGVAPTGWDNLGHTSKENTIKLSTSGGDPTKLDTWLKSAVATIYADSGWALDGSSLQIDNDTLKKIYSGWDTSDKKGTVVPSRKISQSLAMVVVSTDDTGNLGFYIPNTSFGHGDAPSIDPTKFFEAPFHAEFMSAATAALPSRADGTPGLFAMYGPSAFVTTTP